jgi:hypothetical protein
MTPDSYSRALRDAARDADWMRCERLGRLYGWCLLVTQLKRGLRRLAGLALRALRMHAPRRVR